jgi:hypothetical protein
MRAYLLAVVTNKVKNTRFVTAPLEVSCREFAVFLILFGYHSIFMRVLFVDTGAKSH